MIRKKPGAIIEKGIPGAAIPIRRAAPRRVRSTVDNQRSVFLRLCRARITPEEVGLVGGHNSRTLGLRREDVAALSGVSATWYTWLEQGRDMRVSDDVLERISQTFRLNDDERTYLYSLVQHRMPRALAKVHPDAPPDVVRMVQKICMPAVALNLRWDVLAWNELTAAIYRDYGAMPERERNLLEILLLQPGGHMNATQLEVAVQRLCARLRYDYTKYPDDSRFEELVQRLLTNSPLFRRVWQMPDFTVRAYGLHGFTHSRFGALKFEHTSYVPDGHPHIRVVICSPANDAANNAIEEVKAGLAR
jgi:transcriptional regulator with XRE-family HTH domain